MKKAILGAIEQCFLFQTTPVPYSWVVYSCRSSSFKTPPNMLFSDNLSRLNPLNTDFSNVCNKSKFNEAVLSKKIVQNECPLIVSVI